MAAVFIYTKRPLLADNGRLSGELKHIHCVHIMVTCTKFII